MKDRKPSRSFFLIPPAVFRLFWIFMVLNFVVPALLYLYVRMQSDQLEMHVVIWYLKVPAVLYIMAYLTMTSHLLLRRSQQIRQNERINALSLDQLGDFCLYLRAFRSAGKMKLPYAAPQWNYSFFLGTVLDAELAVSLQAHSLGVSVVALGDTATGYGASKINTSDVNWVATYERLADGARFIVMAPFDRPSTLFEIKNILRTPARLRKTLFVMPPRLGFSPLSPRTWIQENFATRWQQTTAHLAKEGLSLPAYDRKGLFFAYDPDDGTLVRHPIVGSSTKATRQLFKTLSQTGNAAAAIASAKQVLASRRARLWALVKGGSRPVAKSSNFIFLLIVGFFVWMEAYQFHVVRGFCVYSSSQRPIPVYNLLDLYRCEDLTWLFWDGYVASDATTRRRLDAELKRFSDGSGIELRPR